MPIGSVKWYSAEKGYGFIKPSEGGEDVFVHANTVKRSGVTELREGQDVAFEVEVGRQGRASAGRVEII